MPECADHGTTCSALGPAYLSRCVLYQNDQLGDPLVCAIFCRYEDADFPCPNKTDYRCKYFDGGAGICVAK